MTENSLHTPYLEDIEKQRTILKDMGLDSKTVNECYVKLLKNAIRTVLDKNIPTNILI